MGVVLREVFPSPVTSVITPARAQPAPRQLLAASCLSPDSSHLRVGSSHFSSSHEQTSLPTSIRISISITAIMKGSTLFTSALAAGTASAGGVHKMKYVTLGAGKRQDGKLTVSQAQQGPSV